MSFDPYILECLRSISEAHFVYAPVFQAEPKPKQKFCVYCQQFKFYDRKARRYTKLQGFYGARCWDCFTLSKYNNAITLEELQTKRIEREQRNATRQIATQQQAIAAELAHVGVKLCSSCNTWQTYKADGLTDKERGFMRAVCWSCWLEKIRIQNSHPLKKLANAARTRITLAITNRWYSPSGKSAKMLGCNYETFEAYIEEQFVEGMTWANYGIIWQIDHRLPLAAVSSEEELLKLCHHTNLQPLLYRQNKDKGTSHDPDEVRAYLELFLEGNEM